MCRKHAWILLASPLLGTLFGFLVSAIVTYMMPNVYESSAVIELRNPAGTPHLSLQGDSSFIRSEMEQLKDADILASVINDLELTNRWAMEKSHAHDMLAKTITTEQIRETDLVAIRARHANRVDAHDIVHGVITAYQKRRAGIDGEKQRQNITELEKAIVDLEISLEQKRRVLAALTRQKPVYQESEEARLASAENYRHEKQKFGTELSFLETMKIKLTSEKIMEKIPSDSVLIHEPPSESHTPLSPNVTFNLIVGSVLGMLAGFPLALLLLWLKSQPARVF